MHLIDVDICPMFDDVIIPKYETEGSAGCDVRAYIKDEINKTANFLTIQYGMRGVPISTGIKVSVPKGYFMAIFPRSGLAKKTTMRISNSVGVLDADYRGELMILCDNIGTDVRDDLRINHQDRIAQLVFLPFYQAKFNIVKELDKTKRGEGGFGSTGIMGI